MLTALCELRHTAPLSLCPRLAGVLQVALFSAMIITAKLVYTNVRKFGSRLSNFRSIFGWQLLDFSWVDRALEVWKQAVKI